MEKEKEAIRLIQEWLHTSIGYLSNREGYPRGFRHGIIRAKEIIADRLREAGINETYPN